MEFVFLIEEPTTSFLTAAPPMYSNDCNPNLLRIEENYSPDFTSNPLKNIAPSLFTSSMSY